MEEDFIYERRKLPGDIKLETVTGGSRYKGKVWQQIALQIYCENGKDGYREVGHFPNGAPFLYNTDERISVSHTYGCLAVATIKAPADSNPAVFSPATAIGIDVESADRGKALDVRPRFLTEEEQAIVPADSVKANVTAWTCKEAMLKAGMDPGIDWLNDITISTLPSPGKEGKGYIRIAGERHELSLMTIETDGYIITIAR